ncbi:SDR family oxidoreductase [Chitinophaga arvensicola]|uniref:NADP-dependent 3-hydroxy acid dehydrogenase YdfG n=1 Tax=Chitinophaga arvensicola TaxID=29529 RepID=A0A1I0S7L0_9BACT|nr:SDR family oxidoreductase [Chitinophaga arvensicola]SEW51764.1 NADP-dependent 3-hydroxy acid dehydrogenase YdfG [Chitinophaga arvensicola]
MSKTILITGTSSGIGKATALHFAAQGWNVIATMRQPEKEQELIRHKNILVTTLDVQQPATINAAIQQGIAHFGHIDVLVNNAGYGEFGIFESTAREQVSTQFEVNVIGVMDTIRAILPHFRERKAGTILNISSGAGRFTLPLISLYCASKFALEGFSEALAFELAALNITVKIIEPGGTTTNFGKVSGDRFIANASIPDYDPFAAAAGKMFDSLSNMQLATAEEVAAVIYEAATDGTDTLRYAVGNEDFKQRLASRHTMPDQEYINAIKNSYLKFL